MTIALDPLPDRVDPTFAVCADGKTVGYIRYDGDDGAWVCAVLVVYLVVMALPGGRS